MFPYGDSPIDPGPKDHIVYVLLIERSGILGEAETVTVAYTTSQTADEAMRRVRSSVYFSKEQAAELSGQRPFILEGATLARLPADDAFFPCARQADHGIVCTAPQKVQHRIHSILQAALRRDEKSLGPIAEVRVLGPRSQDPVVVKLLAIRRLEERQRTAAEKRRILEERQKARIAAGQPPLDIPPPAIESEPVEKALRPDPAVAAQAPTKDGRPRLTLKTPPTTKPAAAKKGRGFDDD